MENREKETYESLEGRLNLELAWHRVKKDIRRKGYFYHPYEFKLIDYNLDNWVDELKNEIVEGYEPAYSEIINVYKPHGRLRRGSILNLKDCVVYSSLILDSIKEIKKAIDWSSQNIRFSNNLVDSDGDNWIKPGVNDLKVFRGKLSDLIENSYNYVLYTDIKSFYDNIEIQKLESDLTALGMKDDSKDLLIKCLYKWNQSGNKGIPQAFKPSDILSEIYMNSIDKKLEKKGITHIRYSDDMRIFCEEKEEAIDALHTLTRLYKEKELSLQTSKSFLLEHDKIKNETKIIAITEESSTNFELSFGPSIESDESPESDESLESKDPDFSPMDYESEDFSYYGIKLYNIDIEDLLYTFHECLKHVKSENFDKKTFHYVIDRFARLKVDYALEYCLDLVLLQPHETKYILNRYFSSLYNKIEIGEKLVGMLKKGKIKLDHQKYLILKWILENDIYSGYILNSMRDFIREAPINHINLDYCIAYLGKYGKDSDYDYIYSFYDKVDREISQATILISINGMKNEIRDSIYSQCKDNDCNILAIDYAESL